jgi:hypothetical protein
MERKLARQQGLDPLAEREDETAGEFAPPEDQPESTE